MMVEEFRDYLTYERRYSTHTVEAYLKDIAQFSDYFQNDLGIEHFYLAQSQHVRLWIVNLVENSVKPSSLHRKLSSLNTYYKFLLKKGKIQSNPAKGIQLPKIPQRLPKYLNKKSVEDLFEKLDESGNHFEEKRDQLIFELFYDTGIRRQELIDLTWRDVDYSLGRIKIFGKGGKERFVPISSYLQELLLNYCEICRKTFEVFEPNGYIILSNKGHQSYPEMIYRIVNKNLKMAQVKTQKSPHVLRHTFATHLSNEGAPLNDIKELLGHASLASTQVYTHNSIEKLKEIFKHSHPKA